MYLTLGRVGNNSFCDRLRDLFCDFSCISTRIYPTKNPLFPNRSRYLLRGFKGFLPLITILEHEIRCFLVILLVFTVKIDAAVFLNLHICDRFARYRTYEASATLPLRERVENCSPSDGNRDFWVSLPINISLRIMLTSS